jgi:hypothetical protein
MLKIVGQKNFGSYRVGSGRIGSGRVGSGRVGSAKLLLGLASIVILGSESQGTPDYILLSHGSGSNANTSGLCRLNTTHCL